MTKKEIINALGLDNYYGSKQAEANKRMLSHSKSTLEVALSTYNKLPSAKTREFIGRGLTDIFKFNGSIDAIEDCKEDK